MLNVGSFHMQCTVCTLDASCFISFVQLVVGFLCGAAHSLMMSAEDGK